MGGSSDSESGSDSGRSNRSFKKGKKGKDKKDDKDGKHKDGKDGKGDKHKGGKDGKDDKHKGGKDDKGDKHKGGKDDKDDKHKGGKDGKDDKHKDGKDGKDGKDDKDDKHKPTSQLPAQVAHVLSGTSLGGLAQEFLQGGGGHGLLREGPGTTGAAPGAPPQIPSNPATGASTGASGQRVACTTSDPFPVQAAGPSPPFVDSTGQPTYVGSALVGGSNVQPCRVSGSGACFIASDGAEVQHSGRYDLLPLTDAMEWVPASGGGPPAGKRVVEGGIENGSSLYHACARVSGVLLPGKAGPALGGAQIPAGGAVHSLTQDYFVLCWRE